jgi:hypothetical protein
VLGTAVAVGSGVDVSEGVAVASGCKKENPQAVMAMDKIKTKVINMASLFDRFMDPSFFEESLANYTSKPPLWAACLYKFIFF